MKYIVMLGDGMADYPLEALAGKTPLAVANKPNMDDLAQHGCVGMAKTVPDGMPPQSDTANLSVMGYDPKAYYTGRSPLEAVSMGIDLAADDLVFRCNLVCVSAEEDYAEKTMIDYSADEISTEESTQLIAYLNERFQDETLALYPGISYRHCLVLKHKRPGGMLTPPHDITLKPVKDSLPKGAHAELLYEMMARSYALLKDHPVNLARIKRGLKPANSCWFWGEGTKPALPSFYETHGVRGGVVSAVDLIKGIGLCAGMDVVDVEGATGNINTNFAGKGAAALSLLQNGCDLVYIHVEAPDESGHRHELENKIKSIERIDADILGQILPALRRNHEPFRVLLMPDHPTPIALRTHTSDPVPFVLYEEGRQAQPRAEVYTEEMAKETGLFVQKGHSLMEKLIKGDF